MATTIRKRATRVRRVAYARARRKPEDILSVIKCQYVTARRGIITYLINVKKRVLLHCAANKSKGEEVKSEGREVREAAILSRFLVKIFWGNVA